MLMVKIILLQPDAFPRYGNYIIYISVIIIPVHPCWVPYSMLGIAIISPLTESHKLDSKTLWLKWDQTIWIIADILVCLLTGQLSVYMIGINILITNAYKRTYLDIFWVSIQCTMIV